MTDLLRRLGRCVRLEDALAAIETELQRVNRDSRDEDFVRSFNAYSKGLADGFTWGFTAGQNKAKGCNPPVHPGKRGPARTVDPGLVFLFAHQLREHRREGVRQRAEAEEFLAIMRAGAKCRGVNVRREHLTSAQQLLAAYWRLRREITF